VNLVDTHCHLYFDSYQKDLDYVLERAAASGVRKILVPGIDPETNRAAVRLAEEHPQIKAAVGIHPNSASSWGMDQSSVFDLASHPQVVAVGEIGLDYYREYSSPDQQRKVLEIMMEIAEQVEKPVVLHVRNKNEGDRSCIVDLIQMIQDWVGKRSAGSWRPQGVVHSFSGNLDESRLVLEEGFLVGITGPVTFKNADTLHAVVQELPLNRLLIETDGPFLSPQPHRGKRNEPAYVRYIAERISELRRQSIIDVTNQTTINAENLFQWSESS
jgi:TatD DNase family protein